MKRLHPLTSTLGAVAVFLVLAGPNHVVHAQYLDPGSGSYLLQMMLAGILATAFVARRALGGFAGALVRYFARTK